MLGTLDWLGSRLPCDVVHLDIAGCGRVSDGVVQVQDRHLREEARTGGYLAEENAFLELDAGRDAIGRLLGLTGAGVAFTDGATSAFATLLAAWPLARGARIGTVPSEYGSNALCLRALAAARDWELVPLEVDDDGRITDLPRLDLVTFPHVPSQRGVVQPVEEITSRGVPVLLDIAQSLGQVPVPPGCAGYVGTSRKWLCGPRGVGFLAVDPLVEPYLEAPPVSTAYTDVRRLDSSESHVAGRLGLGQAVADWNPELLPAIRERAAYARQVLADTPWRVREPAAEPSGITTLEGGDAFATRDALREQGILVGAIPLHRAEDVTVPLLRVSTGPWVSEDDLDRLAEALGRTPRSVGSAT